MEIADNYFGVLQAVVIHQILQLKQEPTVIKINQMKFGFQIIKRVMTIHVCHFCTLKSTSCKCLTHVTTRGNSAVYLQVAMDDIEGVQVRHSLQHLPNHVAGVFLRVVSLVQDPVKHLSTCSTETQSETRNIHVVIRDGLLSRKV